MTKQSFLKGTLILLTAGLMTRLLGFIPRMALPRLIGAEGVGLYQMAYPFLIVLITLVTGGIPVAVAKLVAEAEAEGDEAKAKGILKKALIFALSLAIFFSIIAYLIAPWVISHLLNDERVYLTIFCMIPMITIVAVSSVLRGYFQGKSNMTPTALYQVTEALIRSVAILFFAWKALPYGLEWAAAGAMLGVVLGEVGGMLVLIVQYKRTKKQVTQIKPKAFPLNKLLPLAIPVTGNRLVGSASYFLESIMIIQSLAIAGIATAAATAQYGMLQGMVLPLLLLPGVITFSLSVSLIPALSEAAAKNNHRMIHRRLDQSVRTALISGAPFVVILMMHADPIGRLLYNENDVAMLIMLMAPAALFLYIQAPMQAALQALDKPGDALLNTFIGSAIKLVLIFLLAAKLGWGITGAIVAIMINMVLVTILHSLSIYRLTGFSIKSGLVFKTVLAMSVMAVVMAWINHFWTGDSLFVKMIAIMLPGLITYLLVALSLNLFRLKDFQRFGKKP